MGTAGNSLLGTSRGLGFWLAQDLRNHLADAAKLLLGESRFLDVLPGLVLDNSRVPVIQKRLALISNGT